MDIEETINCDICGCTVCNANIKNIKTDHDVKGVCEKCCFIIKNAPFLTVVDEKILR